MSAEPRFARARDRLLAIASTRSELAEKFQTELTRLHECLRANSTGASEYQQQERVMLDGILRDFRMEGSRAHLFFKERKWTDFPMPQLVSIAELLAKEADVPIDREAQRRKLVLFTWLEDNWDALLPWAQELKFEFEE
jgi:hypothetical protein